MLRLVFWLISLALVKGETCFDASSVQYSTDSGRILINGNNFVLKGINYFGFETTSYTWQGLWGGATNLTNALNFLQNNGFNAVRIPLALSIITSDPSTDVSCSDNPALCGKNSLEQMQYIIQQLASRGILVLLDNHLFNTNDGISELWYSDSYPEATVSSLMKQLLTKVNNWNVFALDLKNEPHGSASWGTGANSTDWDTAAERFIESYSSSFNGLFFVEGVQDNAIGQTGSGHFWGENLEGVHQKPIDTGNAALNKRVVYANHVYGPDVSSQSYFNDASFPSNMPAIWTQHFGFVQNLTGQPLVLGEWGGHYASGTADETWANALSQYLIDNCLSDQFYWCVNPTSGDTGGVLQSDWQTPDSRKIALLKKTQPNPTQLTYDGTKVCISNAGSYPNSACAGSSSSGSATTAAGSNAASSNAAASTAAAAATTAKAAAATTAAPAATTAAAAASTAAAAATTKAASSGSGSVTANAVQSNSWQQSGQEYVQVSINIVNGGSSSICSATLQYQSGVSVSQVWNINSSGNNQLTTDGNFNAAAGATNSNAGGIFIGGVPQFTVTSSGGC